MTTARVYKDKVTAQLGTFEIEGKTLEEVYHVIKDWYENHNDDWDEIKFFTNEPKQYNKMKIFINAERKATTEELSKDRASDLERFMHHEKLTKSDLKKLIKLVPEHPGKFGPQVITPKIMKQI